MLLWSVSAWSDHMNSQDIVLSEDEQTELSRKKQTGQIYLKDLSRFHVIKAHRIYTSRLNIVDAGLRALEPSLTGKARHISYSFSEIHNWERKRWFSRK